MIVKKDFLRNLFVFVLLCLIVISVKSPTLYTPYFDDAAFWYVPISLLISENNLNPIFRGIGIPAQMELTSVRKHPWVSSYISDSSHPVMFYEILASTYLVFGYSVFISHFVVLIFAVLTLFFTYLVGKELYSSKTGFIAALLLLFTPIFFSQSSRLFPEMAVAAFSLMCFYFAFKEKYYAYLFSGIVLVLLKEQGVFAIISIIAYIFIKYKNRISKKELFAKIVNYSTPILALVAWYLFHYLMTGLLITEPSYNQHSTIQQFINNFAFYFKFIIVDQYRIMLTVLVIFFFIKNKKSVFDSRIASLMIMFVMYLVFFSWVNLGFLRHILPVVPIFFILVTDKALLVLKKRLYIILFVLLFIGLSISTYHSKTSFNYEENMRYIDVIKAQQEALIYINEEQNSYANSSNVTIWVDLYTYLNFAYPYVGYVNESITNINLIPIKYLKFEDANTVFKNNFEKGDLVLETSLYTTEIRSDYQIIKILNISLIKEIRVNNDFVKIYKVA